MKHITIPNIEDEIQYLLDHAPMNCDNLERFVLLSKAMKYMSHTHREFTEADAKEWAAHMEPPARWSMEQTTAEMRKHGFHHKPYEFYAAMNMLFSDYGKTVIKYGLDKPEFWAAMANDFLDDQDAEDMKIGRYWRDIVRHE